MAKDNFEDLRDRVESFVLELVDKSSLDLRVQVSLTDEGGVLAIFDGFDLPYLLGHNAELLDALQYITRRVFANEVAEGAQIDFDASGYREARRLELELMAQKAAERVRLSRVPFTFDPMSAQDRRIIHTILYDFEGVKTESEGDGQLRRVRILPA